MNSKIEIFYEDEVVCIINKDLLINITINEDTLIKITNNSIDFKLKDFYRNQKINKVIVHLNEDKRLTLTNINKCKVDIKIDNKYDYEKLIIYKDGDNNDN